jgi:hypothetical protein
MADFMHFQEQLLLTLEGALMDNMAKRLTKIAIVIFTVRSIY